MTSHVCGSADLSAHDADTISSAALKIFDTKMMCKERHNDDCIMHRLPCRWIGTQVLVYLLIHGALYHCLWASAGAQMYRDEAFRFDYAHYVSNGAGLVAWVAALAMTVMLLPCVRRAAYWVRAAAIDADRGCCLANTACVRQMFAPFSMHVCCMTCSQMFTRYCLMPCSNAAPLRKNSSRFKTYLSVQLFYRAHVIGAAVFLIFGTYHWYGVTAYGMLGLIVYGVDVAYRWAQTRHTVQVHAHSDGSADGASIVSLIIPLQVSLAAFDC